MFRRALDFTRLPGGANDLHAGAGVDWSHPKVPYPDSFLVSDGGLPVAPLGEVTSELTACLPGRARDLLGMAGSPATQWLDSTVCRGP